eukprot:4739245-Amphidinium_carterae.7
MSPLFCDMCLESAWNSRPGLAVPLRRRVVCVTKIPLRWFWARCEFPLSTWFVDYLPCGNEGTPCSSDSHQPDATDAIATYTSAHCMQCNPRCRHSDDSSPSFCLHAAVVVGKYFHGYTCAHATVVVVVHLTCHISEDYCECMCSHLAEPCFGKFHGLGSNTAVAVMTNELVNIDVRDLFNQAHDKRLARHTGLHLSNVQALGDHKNLPGVLFEIVSAVAELTRGGILRRNLCPRLCVTIWCKSGRHRSVAVATWLAHHMRRHFLFEVDLIHLCKADWPSQCQGCRGTCCTTGWCQPLSGPEGGIVRK